jgi:hypothetical protein
MFWGIRQVDFRQPSHSQENSLTQWISTMSLRFDWIWQVFGWLACQNYKLEY